MIHFRTLSVISSGLLAALILLLIFASSNPGSAQTYDWRTYSDHDPLLFYSPEMWQTVPVTAAAGSDLTYTTMPGATLSATFIGTGVEIIYAKGAEGGNFQAYIDGTLVQERRSQHPQYTYGHEMTIDKLPADNHTLTLVNVDGATWIESVRVQGMLVAPELESLSTSATTMNLTGGTVRQVAYLPTWTDQLAACYQCEFGFTWTMPFDADAFIFHLEVAPWGGSTNPYVRLARGGGGESLMSHIYVQGFDFYDNQDGFYCIGELNLCEEAFMLRPDLFSRYGRPLVLETFNFGPPLNIYPEGIVASFAGFIGYGGGEMGAFSVNLYAISTLEDGVEVTPPPTYTPSPTNTPMPGCHWEGNTYVCPIVTETPTPTPEVSDCPPIIGETGNGFAQQGSVAAFSGGLCPGWTGGQLVFTDGTNLFRVIGDPDFSATPVATQLTNVTGVNEENNINPALSPDGKGLAFLSNRAGTGSYELYISASDGSYAHRVMVDGNPVIASSVQQLSWSPTNDKIAFVNSSGLHIYNAVPNTITDVSTANDAFVRNPVWSPLNPNEMAYISGSKIKVINPNDPLDAATFRILFNADNLGFISVSSLAWSVQNEIAYVSSTGQLMSVPADDSYFATPLVDSAVQSFNGLAWSPGGDHIAYATIHNMLWIQDRSDPSIKQQVVEGGKFPTWAQMPDAPQPGEKFVVACNGDLPASGGTTAEHLMPVYYTTVTGNSTSIGYIKRGWFVTDATNEYGRVELTLQQITTAPPTWAIAHGVGNPGDYVWYEAKVWYEDVVATEKVINAHGLSVENAVGDILEVIYIPISKGNTSYLLPTVLSNCIEPTLPQLLDDSDGEAICDALFADLSSRELLPSGVMGLEYFTDYPVLNDSTQYSGANPPLVYSQLLSYTVDHDVKVAPCKYEIDGNIVVRFGTSVLLNIGTTPTPETLKAAEYAMLLNYANYFAHGPLDSIRDWCFQGDNLYEQGDLRYGDQFLSDDGTHYNVPPLPGIRCDTTRDTYPDDEGNGPCGTLPASVYRAMGYYNISDFNPDMSTIDINDPTTYPDSEEGTWRLGRYYWGPQMFEQMFSDNIQTTSTEPLYTSTHYKPVRIDFFRNGTLVNFTYTGWDYMGYIDANNNGVYDLGETENNDAIWHTYEVNVGQSAASWETIKAGDILTIHTIEYQGKNRINPPDSYPKDNDLHVELVVGWGPDTGEHDFGDWQNVYDGELYATWQDIPQARLDDAQAEGWEFVPYVIDRGARETNFGTEDHMLRGPRPFHTYYSVSYMNIWVGQN